MNNKGELTLLTLLLIGGAITLIGIGTCTAVDCYQDSFPDDDTDKCKTHLLNNWDKYHVTEGDGERWDRYMAACDAGNWYDLPVEK